MYIIYKFFILNSGKIFFKKNIQFNELFQNETFFKFKKNNDTINK